MSPFCLKLRILCLAYLFASRLCATQFIPLSIEEISSQADLIVRGTVQSKKCARDKEGKIFTTVFLTVSESWKGQARTKLVIVQAGGILGDEGMDIPGQADYQAGE